MPRLAAARFVEVVKVLHQQSVQQKENRTSTCRKERVDLV
jgi:hypothetical protein